MVFLQVLDQLQSSVFDPQKAESLWFPQKYPYHFLIWKQTPKHWLILKLVWFIHQIYLGLIVWCFLWLTWRTKQALGPHTQSSSYSYMYPIDGEVFHLFLSLLSMDHSNGEEVELLCFFHSLIILLLQLHCLWTSLYWYPQVFYFFISTFLVIFPIFYCCNIQIILWS